MYTGGDHLAIAKKDVDEAKQQIEAVGQTLAF